jgi:membrane protein YdbS with pleckstrin-like domain|tara:strand:+ start:801 stop:1079 length:279 start_codon:yes stop_codon:yes gene_type:complete
MFRKISTLVSSLLLAFIIFSFLLGQFNIGNGIYTFVPNNMSGIYILAVIFLSQLFFALFAQKGYRVTLLVVGTFLSLFFFMTLIMAFNWNTP